MTPRNYRFTPSHLKAILWLLAIKCVAIALLMVTFCGCALKQTYTYRAGPSGNSAKALATFKARLYWSGACDPVKVGQAYGNLLGGQGAPWAFLYWDRCRPPSQLELELARVKYGDPRLVAVPPR